MRRRGVWRPYVTRSPPHLLLEREPELTQLTRHMQVAGGGEGGVVLIEGAAGIGKTALLGATCERARELGMQMGAARGGELESGLPWGVVRGLFEPNLAAASKAERRRLLSGAAALARIALRSDAPRRAPIAAETLGAALHGLYWVAANTAARRPLLIAVDDAHWADMPSLRWLAYLAVRVEDLPVLVVATVRPPGAAAHSGSLAAIAQAGTTLRPSSLSPQASATMVRAAVGPDATAAFCDACHLATRGNPFLLGSLARELAKQGVVPDDAAAVRVRGTRAATISRAIVIRLAGQAGDARDLASAIAVFGASPPLAAAAALARLDEDAAAAAADALAADHLIADTEPLEFVHPIVKTAVYSEIPPHQRVRWHARAAHLLDEAEAPTDEIAVHLLAVEPHADAAVVAILRAAAADALAAGAPEPAIAYLGRALAEPPTARHRLAVLRELGVAETSLQRPAGLEHLRAALALAAKPDERAEIARQLAIPLTHSGAIREVVDLLDRTIAEIPEEDRELRLKLEADLIGAGRLDPALRKVAMARVDALAAARLKGRTRGERVALSAVALEARSPHRTAAETIEFAQRALGGGRLLAEAGVESPSFWFAAGALILADGYDLAGPIVESALAEASSQGSAVGSALGFSFRALLGHRTGRLADAEADARQAIAIDPSSRWAASVYALAFLIDVLLDRGRPGEAALALEASRLGDSGQALLPLLVLHHNRGRLRLALGDAEGGRAEMRTAAAQLEAGRFPPHVWPWRSLQAIALAGAGDDEEARRLAHEELELTRAFGAPHALGVSLRAWGLVSPSDRIDSLRESVAVLAGSGAMLEHARALIDLGAALRRAGNRSRSIDSLREGLDLAHRCGAGALAARAREELLAAGAKPRRDALRGREALTASELRTARMAARGLANREIAQALFVSLRTVETHLTHTYQKLEIGSRAGLPAALETVSPPVHPDGAGPSAESKTRAPIARRPRGGSAAEASYEALQRGRGRR
jgi:DNA-binding CsgD family transcriptional regulator